MLWVEYQRPTRPAPAFGDVSLIHSDRHDLLLFYFEITRHISQTVWRGWFLYMALQANPLYVWSILLNLFDLLFDFCFMEKCS